MQIKLKNSVVQDSAPSASDLPEVGELAVNGNINSIGGFMRASDNSIVKIFGPGSVTTPTATTTVSGISELATSSETTTGTATNRVVTPAGLNAVTVAERTTSNTNYVAKAGSTMTGVLTAIAGSNSGPSINFGDSDSGIFGGTNSVSLTAGGTTRLTADTGVTITGALSVSNNIATSAGQITCGVHGTSGIQIINDGTFGTLHSADLVLRTASTERARLDTSGRLLVGHSSNFSISGSNPRFQLIGGSDSTAHGYIGIFSANNVGANFSLVKSRNGTVGSQGLVLANDVVGNINFIASDGNDAAHSAARISAAIDGTAAANDLPGRLVFSTTADGASSPTERLRIDSAGLSSFTGNITTTGTLTVGSASSIFAENNVRFKSSGDAFIDHNTTGQDIKFRVSNSSSLDTTPLTINSDGHVDVAGNLDVGAGIDVTGAITGTTSLTLGNTSLSSGYLINTTGDLYIRDTDGNIFIEAKTDQHAIRCIADGAVMLHHSGNIKLVTSSAGIDVTGAITATGDLTITSATPIINLTENNANPDYRLLTDGGEFVIQNDQSGSFATKFKINADGHIDVTGNLDVGAGIDVTGNIVGTGDLTIDTNTLHVDSTNNRIGIGTTVPGALLHLKADDPIIRLHDTSSDRFGQIVGIDGNLRFDADNANAQANTNITFRTDNTERMRLNDTGLGIGTTSPQATLHEKITTAKTNSVEHMLILEHLSSGTTTTGFGTGIRFRGERNNGVMQNIGDIEFEADVNSGSTISCAMVFKPGVAGVVTEKMRLTSAGLLGLGTTTPEGKGLDVTVSRTNGYAETSDTRNLANIICRNSSDAAGRFAALSFINGGGTQAEGSINLVQTGNYNGDLAFKLRTDVSSWQECMRIKSDGRIFIGNSNPAAAANADDLCIGDNDGSGETGITLGSNTASGIRFADGANNSAAVIQYTHGSTNAFQFSAEGAERMRLTGDGPHLLLGGTADVNEITESSANAGMVIGGTGYGNAGLAIITSTSGTGRLYFGDDVGGNAGRNVGQINYGHSDNHMRFVTDSTERMRIDGNGNVGIGSSPLSRLSIVDSVSSGHLMVIRNNQTRANNVRYGIEFRDSSNETNVTIVAKQTGSNNQASMEIYANNGSGGNGITGGTSGIKAVTMGPGGLTTHKEFGMHDAAATESSKFLDFGFQGHSCNFRRTNGGDANHSTFMAVNSSNVITGDFNDSSDEKLKKNILSVVDGAIENIKKLRPVTFDWIDETRNNDVSGFVAQELKNVLPNLVNGTEYDPTLIDETKGSKGGIKSEGYSINTIGLVAHLTKALQEAIGKIETLETKVAGLEGA